MGGKHAFDLEQTYQTNWTGVYTIFLFLVYTTKQARKVLQGVDSFAQSGSLDSIVDSVAALVSKAEMYIEDEGFQGGEVYKAKWFTSQL